MSRPPATNEEYLAHWDDWARVGGWGGGNRNEAVRRMREWLNHHDATARLNLSGLDLTSLPDHLPSSITDLDVSRNRLTSLPDPLPSSLRDLRVWRNRLTSLSNNNWPSALRSIRADENQLTSLPDPLPASIKYLDVRGNQLTSLPEHIFMLLGNDCLIDVSGNAVLEQDFLGLFDGWNTPVDDPNYRGPGFVLWASAYRPRAASRMGEYRWGNFELAPPLPPPPLTLADTVVNWYEANDQEAVRQAWDLFSDEAGQDAFSNFLDGLGRTVNSGNPPFKQATAQWLSHLAAHAPLRNTTFLISQGAAETCEDRISLTFNDMKKARLADDVERGDYDQRLPDLIDLARGMFRLDQLETIAQKKAKLLQALRSERRMGPVDAIEVYLAYQVKLRDRLKLPLDISNMRYFGAANVTESDLKAAEKSISAAEKNEFFNYLSTDWAPWQSVVKRLDPVAHEAAQAQLFEALETDFAARLHARLKKDGLENSPDAQRQMGVLVQADIQREIKGELTRSFLKAQNLSHLLA